MTADRSEPGDMLQWLDQTPENNGMHFAQAGNQWHYVPYTELAALTERASAALVAHGVGRNDAVALPMPASPEFIAFLFGAQAIGATPCTLATRTLYSSSDEYCGRLTELLGAAKPALIVVEHDSNSEVWQAAQRIGLRAPVVAGDLLAAAESARPVKSPGELGLLQFTSGSTGLGRGVRIPMSSLSSNIAAIRTWLSWHAGSPCITWLPVHHDMGLIGLIASVTAGSDCWVFQPADFIRSPLRYLSCISENLIEITAMPNFGLAYILRRIKQGQLGDLRFDRLRCVVLGAERIVPEVLTDVAALLEQHGFASNALLPAYGGAEATLAVTGLTPGTGWTLRAPAAGPDTNNQVVGCGRPLPGMTVTVVDEYGHAVPDGAVGEIVAAGESIADSYLDHPSADGRLADHTWRTGDAGFMCDGQLYVIGRLCDGLKIRGRMLFAEEVEARLFDGGISHRRAAALLGMHDNVPTAVVVFESAHETWPAIAQERLREYLADISVILLDVPRGGISATSSGKPRRQAMWLEFCAGQLDGRLISDDDHRPGSERTSVSAR
jgi:acyl-CoA synthetase (AMP-forming)/AMP-acid ligase II